RMSTPFVTLHNTCKYFHAHPHAALQKFPNFEERFVHFCVQVLRNTLSYSCSRILDHTTIQLLCDMCLILIDLCPTYGEFILEQVAPTLEPYLAQAKPFYAVLKHPARHCELLVWAMEKRNIAAAKFLVTLSPVVASDKNIYDLDESWATTINPETLEKLHKFNRAITSQQKKFTFGDLFYCIQAPTTENVDRGSGHYRDIPLRSNTPPNIQNLYLANLKDAANQEYLKIKSIISLIKRHPHECTNLKLVPTINYLYKKILNMAGSLKLDIGDNPYNSHFIHRNAVPQLYIYIRTLCVYNNINELLHALTVELEHTTGQHIGNVETLPDKENQQYYLALALDLDICASIFSAEENDQARELANFCRNFIQMLTLNMGGIETFNEYKSTMTSTINEILTPIFEDSLYLQYIGSIMHSLSEQISSDLQELNQEMQRHIGLIPQ
ncbi:MAG: hypothetical protein M1486_05425, partial [Gammaproteobacteria bacterium]|nr:hypothetical protein [Gammaproteobacteria bacterium]